MNITDVVAAFSNEICVTGGVQFLHFLLMRLIKLSEQEAVGDTADNVVLDEDLGMRKAKQRVILLYQLQ